MKKYFLLLAILFCTFQLTQAQYWGDSTNFVRPLFYSAEINASFPGGLKAYYQFLADNLHMPANRFAEFSNKLVMIRIIIDTMGTVVFAGVEHGVNKNYNNEALKLIKAMPAWTPAKQNGRSVSMSMNIPILFVD
jgi:protein TonB